MKIFVTGATGYIGENLALKLKSLNHDIYALVRSRDKSSGLVAHGIHLIKGDIFNKELLDAGIKGCDVVFHLAAYSKAETGDVEIFKKINIEGTRNILEASEKNKVKKLIFTSTAGVFSPSANGREINEDTLPQVPFLNLHESTKAEAEDLVKEYAQKGLHAVIVNPAQVYGPGRRTEGNAFSKIVEDYLDGKQNFFSGTGAASKCISFIDDVVDGHLQALEVGRSGENYILGGENVSNEFLFRLIKKHSETNKDHSEVTSFISGFLNRLKVLSSNIFKKSPSTTPEWQKKYRLNGKISSRKAIEELGYKITPLDRGIKKTVNWLQNSEEEKTYTLITGSSSGIGKAMAEVCAKKNYNLILVALPDTGLEKVSKELQLKYNVDVKYFEINLTEEGAVTNLYNWVDVLNLKIDKLINNAGIGDSSCFECTHLDYYLQMMQINSQAVVSLTSTFIPKLQEHEQSYILNMGSFAGLMPVPYKSVYSATKSFVVAFSRALQMELKQFGIHVSCICPGPTSTESVMARHQRIGNSSELLMMTPEEVATVAIEGMLKQKGLIVPGWKNKFILGFSNIAPYVLKYYLLNKIFEKSVEKTTTYSIKSSSKIGSPIHESH